MTDLPHTSACSMPSDSAASPAGKQAAGLRAAARHTARWAFALSCASAALFAGCASSPTVQLYRLSAELPAGVAPVGTPPQQAALWALVSVTLPDYLDRDAIMVPRGQAGLISLPGQRWAEPLRDAVTRVMRTDLARLRGEDTLWSLPMPPGLRAQAYLKVELLTFEASSDRASLHLTARWWLTDPMGTRPAEIHQLSFDTPIQGSDTDALAAAHRMALWTLAQHIAKDSPPTNQPIGKTPTD